ncbi:MAG: Peroxide operon regulator [Acidimicrobiales bacterium]|nr:MAG: transcriptional repressor [Actinomycetota bacterium]MBV6508897.1 Peroxide operon regulator [Acidimicrobiales bacterium]RIK03940.1 MAG: hypothetical protein DCC48_14635 [Acidobacteriota bacterium]
MPAMDDHVHDEVAERLELRGQRYTETRRSLVDVLISASMPLTLPEILAQGRTLAQSSVYRNLSELEKAGVVHRVVTADDHARFELAEHLTGHHHHLVCSSCGAVIDFTVPSRLEGTLERELASVAERHGFVVDHHRLDILGACTDCATPRPSAPRLLGSITPSIRGNRCQEGPGGASPH